VTSDIGFSLALAVGVKVWNFALRSDSPTMSKTNIQVVKDGIVESDTVIPYGDSVLLPLETDLEVQSTSNVSIEEIQDCLRLSLADTNDATSETRLDEQALPSGDRVSTDNRMDGFDGCATDCVASSGSSVALVKTRVNCLQTVNELLESRGQLVISSIARCPKRVTTNTWEGIDFQEGETSRVL
jgi:hypothetical protein